MTDPVLQPAEAYLNSWLKASEAPIVSPVKWPADIPTDHPLQKNALYVRYWPVAVQVYITEAIKAQDALTKEEQTWAKDTFYYIIAASACDKFGIPAFNAIWPQVWDKHLLTLTAEQLSDLSKDENNIPVLPLPDFNLIGAWLSDRFDAAEQGRKIMYTIWNEAVEYNGFKADTAKNSESTVLSGLSIEQPVNKDGR